MEQQNWQPSNCARNTQDSVTCCLGVNLELYTPLIEPAIRMHAKKLFGLFLGCLCNTSIVPLSYIFCSEYLQLEIYF